MAGGGKGGQKMSVTQYFMSQHFGICSPVDSIRKIYAKEKLAWSGEVTTQSAIAIDNTELFGGDKKEGGVAGLAFFLPGFEDQVLPDSLAAKLQRPSGAECPGFRGLASVFFTGNGGGMGDGGFITIGGTGSGFYWAANNPYLPAVWIEVRRAPVGLNPDYAMIPRPGSSGTGGTGGGNPLITAVPLTFSAKGDGAHTFDPGESGAGYTIVNLTWSLEFTAHDDEGNTDLINVGSFANSFTPATSPYEPDRTESDSFSTAVGTISWEATYHDNGDFEFSISSERSLTIEPFAEDSEGFMNGGFAVSWTYRNDPEASWNIQPKINDGSIASNPYYNVSLTPSGAGSDWVGGFDIGAPAVAGVSELDANPAHMIYESLTNTDWGMGSPAELIDTASFEAAGITLFNEPLGLSMIWTRQAEIQKFIQEVLDHIQGVLFVDPQTGLLTLKLIRGDYDPDTLPILDESNADLTNFGRKLWGEISNEIVVTWTNPETEQDETVSVHDLASVATQGGVVSDSRNYYGVRYADLAKRLASRDLRSAGAPLASCEAEVDRTQWALRPASCIRLNWPEYGLSGVVMRITKIGYGKPGDPTIKLTLVEDVFGLDAGDYTAPPGTSWIDPSAAPSAVNDQQIVTLPYFAVVQEVSPADAAYPEVMSGVLAASDNADIYSVELLSLSGSDWESLGTVGLQPRGELDVDLVAEASSTGVTFTSFVGSAGPEDGGFALIGDGDEAEDEIVQVAVGSSSYTLSRGALDTVPHAWPAGTPVWFFSLNDSFADPTTRSVGEEVSYKLLTRTSQGLLSRYAATSVSATLSDRPWLPNRPANVEIGGVGFNDIDTPVDQTGESLITVSWSNRNRLLEDSTVLDWTDATVTPETDQTTTITVLDVDGTTVLTTHGGLTGTSFDIPIASFNGLGLAIVEVSSSRTDDDGTFESLQAHRLFVQVTATYYEVGIIGNSTDLSLAYSMFNDEVGVYDPEVPAGGGWAKTVFLEVYDTTAGNKFKPVLYDGTGSGATPIAVGQEITFPTTLVSTNTQYSVDWNADGSALFIPEGATLGYKTSGNTNVRAGFGTVYWKANPYGSAPPNPLGTTSNSPKLPGIWMPYSVGGP